jgi:GDPmannose 4,6-dehydratase
MKALISGINGQDGSFLSELLLDKGYEVHGIIRRHSVENTQDIRIYHIRDRIKVHYGDLTDSSSLEQILKDVQPDEIYNLAAQSQVWVSSKVPIYTSQVNAIGVLHLLEAMRSICPHAKFYQAGSSEMFGNNVDSDGFQRESTNMEPVSPYGISKLFAHNMVKHYRDAYGIFASNGILYNHESSRRGLSFVTMKIVNGALNILAGKQDKLHLGNLNSHRDWSHSKDMVRGMWMMLQHKEPDDFVLSSGETHSVEEFCRLVFGRFNMKYRDKIVIDESLFRPQELFYLKGDCSKAREILGWYPEYDFDGLIDEMIDGNRSMVDELTYNKSKLGI